MSQTKSAASDVLLQDWRKVAPFIDHSLLRPESTREQVVRLCQEAVHYGFPAVFAHPSYVAIAASVLRGTSVKPGTTVGFSMGSTLTTVKRFEALEVLRLGAGELDMVMNVGALKSGAHQLVENDIRSIVEIAHDAGAILKVILETSLLTREEKVTACELSVAARADFVKTSTGLLGGATVEDVVLMRSVVGNRAKVKASGGVRTLAQLAAMVTAGAERIGTSSGVAMVQEAGASDLPI
ncbi:MAG TPA: deoxyribose-phosphate aldolase [Terriglobales bacterium]|nr:deoxyribose-phosphate aldolase [Terriglobales bacterium]